MRGPMNDKLEIDVFRSYDEVGMRWNYNHSAIFILGEDYHNGWMHAQLEFFEREQSIRMYESKKKKRYHPEITQVHVHTPGLFMMLPFHLIRSLFIQYRKCKWSFQSTESISGFMAVTAE